MMPAQAMRLRKLWNPSMLTTPVKIWLDHTTSVTDVSGNASQWNDKSGNSWHFSQATSTQRPLIVASGLNSLRTLRFDGTDDILACGVAGSLDLFRNTGAGWSFAVAKKMTTDGVDTERSIFFVSTNGVSARFSHSIANAGAGGANKPATAARRLDADAFARLSGPSVPTVGSFHMFMNTQNWSTGAGTLYVDGTSVASSPTLTSAGLTSNTASGLNLGIGAAANGAGAQFADMEIAMFLSGSGALPAADEIDRIFGYAAWTYGIAGNLPAGHPYKVVRP
jgi:hypothetical protein